MSLNGGTISQSDDTICSISTPVGTVGIGIIRMSGAGAVTISKKIFVPFLDQQAFPANGYSIRYGKIKDPGTESIIDEVLLTVMKAPGTYTREDVVEINCHSGPAVLKQILTLLVSLGARLAEPGEFTKRAFLNGRIDLAQAEAVMSLVSAKTDMALRASVRQLEGGLSRQIQEIRSDLVQLLSEIEAAIDFPEEGLDLIQPDEIKKKTAKVLGHIESLIKSSETGKLLMEGISVAIVGKANVGKSSLLNSLLMEDRAIVTPLPGTTRDVIEATINLEGVPMKVLDTAGIRASRDPIEQEGIKRSEKCIAMADIVIMVVDLSNGPDHEDHKIARLVRGKKSVLVVNKTDLIQGEEEKDEFKTIIEEIETKDVYYTATINNKGLNGLKSGLSQMVLQGRGGAVESVVVTNLRHVSALLSVQRSLLRVLDEVDQGLSEEFLSLELRSAVTALGGITGETSTEEVLDEIFRSFCVGK